MEFSEKKVQGSSLIKNLTYDKYLNFVSGLLEIMMLATKVLTKSPSPNI